MRESLDGWRRCRCFFPLSSDAEPAFWILLRLQVTKFPGLRLRFLWLLFSPFHMEVWVWVMRLRYIRARFVFVNCAQRLFQLSRLTRRRRQFVVYFLPFRGEPGEKGGEMPNRVLSTSKLPAHLRTARKKRNHAVVLAASPGQSKPA